MLNQSSPFQVIGPLSSSAASAKYDTDAQKRMRHVANPVVNLDLCSYLGDKIGLILKTIDVPRCFNRYLVDVINCVLSNLNLINYK